MSFIYGPSGGGSSLTSLLMIIGDTGVAVADTITLTGSTNQPYFTGAASTITETINYINLPTTTSAGVGMVTVNGNRFMHNFVASNTNLGSLTSNFSETSTSMVNIGYQAGNGAGTSGHGNNQWIGTRAGNAMTTSNNAVVAIGYQAAYQMTTGNGSSVFVGDNVCSSAGTTVTNCNIFGLNAMTGSSKTSPVNNNVFGANAGTGITTGTRNVLLGDSAGQDITTASSSIRINNVTMANTGNQLVIGAGTGTGTRQLNESFIHGIFGITTVNANAIAVLVDSAGQLGTVSSSARFKENIEDMGDVSSSIKDLRPVTFDFKYKPNYKKQVGLIAEEVKKVIPNLVVHDKDGEVESVKYHEISIYLLNELKKALKKVEYLESKLI
jgi:hypothetical protein